MTKYVASTTLRSADWANTTTQLTLLDARPLTSGVVVLRYQFK